jgi:selenocysteine-specific elongation factor
MIELALLEGDELRGGAAGWVQLFAAQPLVVLDGDRFILRVPSPPSTVAGGVIVDSAPRRHRRRDPAVLRDLAARERADPKIAAVLELGKHPWGLLDAELAGRLGVTAARIAEIVAPLVDLGAVRRLGSRSLTRDQWERAVSGVINELNGHHAAQPLRRGIPKEELRGRTGIPAELLSDLLTELAADGSVVERAGEVAAATHHPSLSAAQESEIAAMVAELEGQPFNPPPLPELIRRYQLTPALLQYLVADGRLVRVNDDTAFARSAYDDAVRRLRLHLTEHRTLTVAAARDVLGSSRRYVLPLLEWLDAQKITRRVGDDRILRN